jgi:hypothetical protein
MLGKPRDRRTVRVGDNIGEPGSAGNCDDNLVLLPECRAESTKLKGGNHKKSYAYMRRIINADANRNERAPNACVTV